MKLLKALAVLAAIGVAGPADAISKCVDKDGRAVWRDRCLANETAGDAPKAASPFQAGETSAPQPSAPPAPTEMPAGPSPPSDPQPAAREAPADPSYEPSTEASTEPSPESARQAEDTQEAAAEFEQRAKRKLVFLFLGAVMMLAGWLMHIVAAAKSEQIAWAVLLFLFSPFSNVLYTLTNWDKARLGFFVYVGGIAMLAWTAFSLFSGMVPQA